mmetsp:Transcript_5992/g.17357  ORF Transcript_5992/g.17357 Transcript_5992/m.17357 type:complete len:250 (+) Transcript_5992:431-1180(+)
MCEEAFGITLCEWLSSHHVSDIDALRTAAAHVAIEENMLHLGLSQASGMVNQEQLASCRILALALPIRHVVNNGSRVGTLEHLVLHASIHLVVIRSELILSGRKCRRTLLGRSTFGGSIASNWSSRTSQRCNLTRPCNLCCVACWATGEMQLASATIEAAQVCIDESHVPRAFITTHRRWLLCLVLAVVSRVLSLTKELKLPLHDGNLLFTEAPKDEREASVLFRQLVQELPEGWQDLMPSKAHDALRL